MEDEHTPTQEHGPVQRDEPRSPTLHRRTQSEAVNSPSRSEPPRLWTNRESDQGASQPIQKSTSPASNNPHTGPLSPDQYDRVFPIRSVVSVDPAAQTPTSRSETSDGWPFNYSQSSSQQPSVLGRRASNASAASSDRQSQRQGSEAAMRTKAGDSARFGPTSQPRSSRMDQTRQGSTPRTPAEDARLRQYQLPSDNQSQHSGSTSHVSSVKGQPASMRSGDDYYGGVVTARFKHVVTEGGHAIMTGRDGETLQRCEDEPIHIPGAIQGFGLLIAMSESPDGKLPINVVSENSQRLIGFTPNELFTLGSFTDILSEEQTDNLLDHIDFIKDADTDPATSGPEVFTLSIRHPVTRRSQKFWAAVHINLSAPETIICEFELEDDHLNPLVPPDEGSPEPPEDTLSSNPTVEELAESTVNYSKPLRVLRSARKKKGEAAAMEVFNIMTQIEHQLTNAENLDRFLKTLIGVVKELTGFHRVMIYQFDQGYNGRVVSELVDVRATKDLYRGLNFPASDIPKQARELYKVNKVRLLYDRDQETARLVCRSVQWLENPLDLTYSYLRAMSPIHLKYLANMAVRSSMSISINAFGELWGLIACHTYGVKGTRVSFPIRKMCRLVGDQASRNIERLSYASRLQARKLINTVPTEKNPSGYIVASSEDLLKLFDADYGLLSIRDETKSLGRFEATQEALALLEYFRLRKVSAVVTSQDIAMDFPDLRYGPGFTAIAGLLLVPLSSTGLDFIIFFRKGQLREVKWAGNPYEKYVKEGTEGYLEPRKSFKSWTEMVAGKCRDWTEEQIETAAVLCLVYGKFIDVWRQKEAALEQSQLTKLLLANSAHEVRTPLNAIINYLEIAMEGSLDTETRENLTRSHSASKSLIYVINDLLDLTKTEEGKTMVKDDVFDFTETVREATDVFKGDAKRKGLTYDVVENPGLPRLVVGDQRRVRQAISNVTANAFQFTNSGFVRVELYLASIAEGRAEIDIVVADSGCGMSPKQLDDLFRELEQVQMSSDEQLPDLISPEDQSKSIAQAEGERRTLGLGLAVVSRIIHNMNGQLRLKSEEGKGSRFVIQLGFDLPALPEGTKSIEAGKQPDTPGLTAPPVTPPATEGEVTLVPKSTPKPELQPSRKQSRESLSSVKSQSSLKSFKSGSSARSDVDRLIDAIQEPHVTNDSSLKRSSSGGRTGIAAQLSSRPSFARSKTYDPSEANLDDKTSLQLAQEFAVEKSKSGQTMVQDQKTPIKPVRVPEDFEFGEKSKLRTPRNTSRVSFDLSEQKPRASTLTQPATADHLQVLVAEDDPVNSKIMSKRLERAGHKTTLTVNGEDCATAYADNQASFDVVLMDMQVRPPPLSMQ